MLLNSKALVWASVAVFGGCLTTMALMALDRDSLRKKLDAAETRVAELEMSIATHQATIATLNDTKMDGEEIARMSARACAASVKFQMRASSEAQEILNATDDDAAARAYDRLLCQRPEAAGHPACAAAVADPG